MAIIRLPAAQLIALLVSAAVLCPGCARREKQRPVYPVRGQVLFRGKPLARAFIVFHPRNDPDPRPVKPRAYTDQTGWFQLTTFQTGDGAPTGEYAVTVVWPERGPGDDEGEGDPPDRFQGRYGDPATSGLRAVIEAKPNELPPFELPVKK